jgi:hypothetical protein
MSSSIQSKKTASTQALINQLKNSKRTTTPQDSKRMETRGTAANLISQNIKNSAEVKVSTDVSLGTVNSSSGKTSTKAIRATVEFKPTDPSNIHNDSVAISIEQRAVTRTKIVTRPGTPGTADIPGTPGTPGKAATKDFFDENDNLVRAKEAIPGTPGTPGIAGTPGTPASTRKVTEPIDQTELKITANRPNNLGKGSVWVGAAFENGKSTNVSIGVEQKFNPQKLGKDTTLKTSASVFTVIPTTGGEASYRVKGTADVEHKLSPSTNVYAGGAAELGGTSQGITPVVSVNAGVTQKLGENFSLNAQYQQNVLGADGNALKVGVGYSL